MNKQLILLATLVATQASVNAFDADAMKTMENMQNLSACMNTTESWIPTSMKNAASTSKEYVSETVVPFAANSFDKAKECCSDVKQFLGNFGKAAPTRFESFKTSLLSLKDSAVAYVSSFNKSIMPSWETTKNAVNGFKNSTTTAMQQACQSIKENAPVYFDAAKKYVEENPGKATAITAGSIATMFAIYKTVKYFSNKQQELYNEFEEYAAQNHDDIAEVRLQTINMLYCYDSLTNKELKNKAAKKFHEVKKMTPEQAAIWLRA